MIIKMYKDVISNTPEMKYKDMVITLSRNTGIGRDTICKTIAEYKKTGAVSSPNMTRTRQSLFDKFDDLDRNGLRQKVHAIWLQRELPTIERILSAVNEDPMLPDLKRTTLYNIIKKLDFVFTKRKRCSVLTEKEDLIVWRRRYLYDVRKYREEGRTIYFLGETWLDGGGFCDHACADEKPLSKRDTFNDALSIGPDNPTGDGKRLFVLHVGSAKGFLPGGLLCFESSKNSADRHDELNGEIFIDWFESVLPRFDPNSVIVMDNAPCHSVKTEKIPTSEWKKADTLEWLNSKGVVLSRPMLKVELLRKVREIKPRYDSCVVDNLTRNAGHTVLRLPPYHLELNPMESAWSMVKNHVTQNNTSYQISDVRELLDTAVERVTARDWENFIERVIAEENKIWEVDDIMDETIDQLEPCVQTVTGEPSLSDD